MNWTGANSKFLENNLSPVTIVTPTSETVGVVKKSYDILPKLGGYATEEGKKIEKKLKACLISKDRLQTEDRKSVV